MLTIFNAILTCLDHHRFKDAYLERNTIAFASDGSSVMLDKKSGDAKLMTYCFKKILVWHSLNHRLELEVSNTIGVIAVVNHFQICLKSCIRCIGILRRIHNELHVCVKDLHEQLKKITLF